MELTETEKWHRKNLLKLAKGFFETYLQINNFLQTNDDESLLETINILNKLYATEFYYYNYLLEKREVSALLTNFEKERNKMSSKTNFEAIISKEIATLPLRRIIKKLNYCKRKEEINYIEGCLKEAAELQIERIFFSFLDEDANKKDNEKDIRKNLKSAKLQFIYLSNYESQYINSLFQSSQKEKIPDYIENTRQRLHISQAKVNDLKKEYGQTIIQEEIEKILQFSDQELNNNHEILTQAILYQERLRTGCLFLETSDLERIRLEFNNRKNTIQLNQSQLAIFFINNTFECIPGDKKRLIKKDNPKLIK